MFSARTEWPRHPNRISRLLEDRRARGLRVLDLTVSNPTEASLLAPEWVLAALADPRALHYAPNAKGLPEAREAVRADLARRGAAFGPEQIVLTASTSEAYALLFKILADPGGEVLVPRPSYPLFDYLAGLESVAVAHYPLAYDGEWHLSVDAVEHAITPRTRVIVVVHPNNPTGSFVKCDEAARLLRLAAARDLAVVSDEVFADFALGPDPRRAGTLALDAPALTFSLGGLSKSCGLPQLKLGWIVVGGPAALAAEALARLEIVADSYLSVSTPVQWAARSILGRLPELQAPIQARLRENLGHLEAATKCSPVSLLRCEGGWSALLQVPATQSEDRWVEQLLTEDGVLVHPGYFFEMPGEAFLVVSLLAETDVFRNGLSRLVARVAASA